MLLVPAENEVIQSVIVRYPIMLISNSSGVYLFVLFFMGYLTPN